MYGVDLGLKRQGKVWQLNHTITVFMAESLPKIASYLWTVKPPEKEKAIEKIVKTLNPSKMDSVFISTFPKKDIDEAVKDIKGYSKIMLLHGLNQVEHRTKPMTKSKLLGTLGRTYKGI